MKNAILIGLGIGVITTLISFISGRVFGYENIFSFSSLGLSMLITLGLLVFLGRKYLRPDGGTGLLSYGEALKYLFVATIFLNLFSGISGVLMYQDNEQVKIAFEDYTRSASEKGVELGMKAAGASQDEIELKIEEFREEYEAGEIPRNDYPFTMAKIPLNFLMASIFGLVYALIAAIFVKKND